MSSFSRLGSSSVPKDTISNTLESDYPARQIQAVDQQIGAAQASSPLSRTLAGVAPNCDLLGLSDPEQHSASQAVAPGTLQLQPSAPLDTWTSHPCPQSNQPRMHLEGDSENHSQVDDVDDLEEGEVDDSDSEAFPLSTDSMIIGDDQQHSIGKDGRGPAAEMSFETKTNEPLRLILKEEKRLALAFLQIANFTYQQLREEGLDGDLLRDLFRELETLSLNRLAANHSSLVSSARLPSTVEQSSMKEKLQVGSRDEYLARLKALQKKPTPNEHEGITNTTTQLGGDIATIMTTSNPSSDIPLQSPVLNDGEIQGETIRSSSERLTQSNLGLDFGDRVAISTDVELEVDPINSRKEKLARLREEALKSAKAAQARKELAAARAGRFLDENFGARTDSANSTPSLKSSSKRQLSTEYAEDEDISAKRLFGRPRFNSDQDDCIIEASDDEHETESEGGIDQRETPLFLNERAPALQRSVKSLHAHEKKISEMRLKIQALERKNKPKPAVAKDSSKLLDQLGDQPSRINMTEGFSDILPPAAVSQRRHSPSNNPSLIELDDRGTRDMNESEREAGKSVEENFQIASNHGLQQKDSQAKNTEYALAGYRDIQLAHGAVEAGESQIVGTSRAYKGDISTEAQLAPPSTSGQDQSRPGTSASSYGESTSSMSISEMDSDISNGEDQQNLAMEISDSDLDSDEVYEPPEVASIMNERTISQPLDAPGNALESETTTASLLDGNAKNSSNKLEESVLQTGSYGCQDFTTTNALISNDIALVESQAAKPDSQTSTGDGADSIYGSDNDSVHVSVEHNRDPTPDDYDLSTSDSDGTSSDGETDVQYSETQLLHGRRPSSDNSVSNSANAQNHGLYKNMPDSPPQQQPVEQSIDGATATVIIEESESVPNKASNHLLLGQQPFSEGLLGQSDVGVAIPSTMLSDQS